MDYKTRNPGSTFNLIVRYAPAENLADSSMEQFTDLSMGTKAPRYAVKFVNQGSELIQIEEVLTDLMRKKALAASKGTFDSGELVDEQTPPQPLDFKKLVTDRSNQFQVQVNGLPAVTVTLKPATDAADGDHLCAAIQAAVQGAGAQPALQQFTCQFQNNKIVMTSGEAGEDSRVEVLPGITNDIFGKLKLGLGDGAKQVDAVSCLRPPAGSYVLEGGDEKDFDETQEPELFVPPPVAGKTLRQGIYALEAVDLFNLLCLPGMKAPDILDAAAKYCEDRRAFLIADAPGGRETSPVTPDQMERVIAGTSYPKTKNGAVFYPWIRVGDTLRPPSGTVAGLMARTDAARGVWKAPAGTEATLLGVRGLEYTLTDRENGVLNPHGVNCIRLFPNYGIIMWGSRTLMGDDAQASEWKYIPIRRLALFIEETLYRNTKWVVFEPNDEPL